MCERDKLILKMNFPAVLHIQYSKAVCLSMGLALVYETHYSGGPCVSEKSSKEAGDWLLVAEATTNYESSHAVPRPSVDPATLLTCGPT